MISCVSERKTTAWSLSAARIPDILADRFGVLVAQDFDGGTIEDGNDGAGGSHTLQRQGRRFVIEIDAVSLRSVSLFTVVSVGKRLQRLTSEKYDV
jgi:hypothetical protein